jgi:phage-related protein
MVMTGIDTLLKAVADKTPDLVKSGYEILLGFLKGVRDNITEVVNVSYDIITAYLNAVAERIPELIDSGWNLIISFIDGMTSSVEEHLPQLINSTQALGVAIVKGVIQGLIQSRETARNGIIEIAKMLVEGFKSFLGIRSPSTVFMTMAGDIVRGVLEGLKNNAFLVYNEIRNIAQRMVDNFRGNVSNMYNAGKDLVIGFANGVGGYISTAVNKARDLALQVLAKIKSVLGIKSPSEALMEVGRYVDLGLSGGIAQYAGVVMRSVEDLGSDTVSKFGEIISGITNAMNTDMNMEPQIRPVLDLSDIQSGSSLIEGILGGKRLNLAVASVRAASISTSGQLAGETQTSQQTGTAPAVSFTQNNYSPKSLSRIEIYRQTKNALSNAKELVGV